MADNDPRSLPRLGFIGLGGMGGRMARRLLCRRIRPDGARPNPRARESPGAERCEVRPQTPQRVAAAVDVVLSSLTDDAALEEVMFGPEGALAAARPGTIFIDMSTVSPHTSLRLQETAENQRSRGTWMPRSSGSTPQAQEGTARDPRGWEGGRVSEMPADPRRAG